MVDASQQCRRLKGCFRAVLFPVVFYQGLSWVWQALYPFSKVEVPTWEWLLLSLTVHTTQYLGAFQLLLVVGEVGHATDMQWAETRNGDHRHPSGKGQPWQRIIQPWTSLVSRSKCDEASCHSARPSMFNFYYFFKNVYLFGYHPVLFEKHNLIVNICMILFLVF